MMLEIVTTPIDVSFYKVEVIELDKGTSNVHGFFVTNWPPVHVPNPDWTILNQENKWEDMARFYDCTPSWSQGTYQWNIEVRWRTVGEDGQGEKLADRIQLHTIQNPSGISTISKMGQSSTRTP